MIKLNHITKRFGDKLILDDLSLTLPERGILCLMGPSGCGKTTLLRILLGLELPDSGQVIGLQHGEAAVVFQEDRLLPWFSVLDNLTKSTGCTAETAAQLLDSVGLSAEYNARPDELSGGMQRRVALARALAYRSKCLVFDEPLKGLDPALKEQLYPLIRNAAADKPLIMVTHNRTEADALADLLFVADGPPFTLK